jgi:hypothetical protein
VLLLYYYNPHGQDAKVRHRSLDHPGQPSDSSRPSVRSWHPARVQFSSPVLLAAVSPIERYHQASASAFSTTATSSRPCKFRCSRRRGHQKRTTPFAESIADSVAFLILWLATDWRTNPILEIRFKVSHEWAAEVKRLWHPRRWEDATISCHGLQALPMGLRMGIVYIRGV